MEEKTNYLKKSRTSSSGSFTGISRLFEVLHEHDTTASELRHIYDAFVMQNEQTPEENKLNKQEYAMLDAVNNLFVKPAKKKVAIDIPADKVLEFNTLAPAIKGGSGKYLRCNIKEVESAFQWLFKNYPTHNNWDIIMQAGEMYWNDMMQENYKYARRVKYLIRKQMQDKSFESELVEYYQRILDGDLGNRVDNHFQERVV